MTEDNYRDLTPEEEIFIKEKLDSKNIKYNPDDKTYKKEEVSERSRASATLWTLFRPRNWSFIILLIAGIFISFIISSINKVDQFLGTGIVDYIEESGSSLQDFANSSGFNITSIQDFIYFYDNRSIILTIIIVIAIILITILFVIDTILQNKRDKKDEKFLKD